MQLHSSLDSHPALTHTPPPPPPCCLCCCVVLYRAKMTIRPYLTWLEKRHPVCEPRQHNRVLCMLLMCTHNSIKRNKKTKLHNRYYATNSTSKDWEELSAGCSSSSPVSRIIKELNWFKISMKWQLPTHIKGSCMFMLYINLCYSTILHASGFATCYYLPL